MKYQLADHVSFTEVDDEAVLLDLNSGAYYGLNHVGAMLMSYLQDQKTPEFASTAIAKQYLTPHITVARDIELLVQQLLEQKLIVER
ncbi:MAG: PqqD family protein [Arenicella sp.]|nr:PqqD family protein [Arenicella sp.]